MLYKIIIHKINFIQINLKLIKKGKKSIANMYNLYFIFDNIITNILFIQLT